MYSYSAGWILEFTEAKSGLKVELQMNKILEVTNSQLILTYCMLDERFHGLALLLKRWNRKHFPNQMKRLNSYSIVLMLLALFQELEILPNLQELYRKNQASILISDKSRQVIYVKNIKKGELARGVPEFKKCLLKSDIGFEQDRDEILRFMESKPSE